MVNDILNALAGGILIGIAASGMMWANGRVLGVSGILGGLFNRQGIELRWRELFIIGLLVGGVVVALSGDYTLMEIPVSRGMAAAVVGGLLVGMGSSLGNGCTSGHGVCGISRFSKRSLVATVTFMSFGILAVTLLRIFGGV